MVPHSALAHFRGTASADFTIQIRTISAHTCRISVLPFVDGRALDVPTNGSLVERFWGAPAATWRSSSLRAETVKCGELSVSLKVDPLTVNVAERGWCDRAVAGDRSERRNGFVRRRERAAAGIGRRRATVRSTRVDRQNGERTGRLSAGDAWRARADSMARGNERMGDLFQSTVWHVRFVGGESEVSSEEGRRVAATRYFCGGIEGTSDDFGGICAADGSSGNAAALEPRVSAVASDTGERRRSSWRSENFSRKEIAVRRTDLSRDGILPFGMEYGKRIVCVE